MLKKFKAEAPPETPAQAAQFLYHAVRHLNQRRLTKADRKAIDLLYKVIEKIEDSWVEV